ncbi:MAG: hypothetical protein GY849_01100, partial [Deltaproteobacteria bacterium]|nr:hypothetical protein [Deltaproteobacteria bacterium]
LATRYDDYGTYVDLLMELEIAEPGRDHAARALEASERARARSLLESRAEARAGLRKRAAPELLARERTLRAKINAREDLRVRFLSEGSAREQTEALEEELRSLLLEYEKVQGEIRSAGSRHALTEPQPLTLRQIRDEVLDDETLLLAYTLGEERSFLWVVSRDSLTSYLLPRRAEIEELAR